MATTGRKLISPPVNLGNGICWTESVMHLWPQILDRHSLQLFTIDINGEVFETGTYTLVPWCYLDTETKETVINNMLTVYEKLIKEGI